MIVKNKILRIIAYIIILYSRIRRKILVVCLKQLFLKVGNDVWFDPDGTYTYKNIVIGNHVRIGLGASFIASETTINIGNKVLFGPNVTIRGGNHNIKKVGKYIYDVLEKDDNDDQPVIIEDDVWIGTGVIILKGVRIGRGAIVGAGSVITRDVLTYTIVCGIPAKIRSWRWDIKKILEHEKKLYPEELRLSKRYLLSIIDEK